MPTKTELRIKQTRRTQESGAILLPLLEDLLEKPVNIDDESDIEFLTTLMHARSRKREKGVFSPSMLGACLRQSYFAKNQQERAPVVSPTLHSYFVDGDWRHFKWQFCLWKLHRLSKITLYGCEVRIWSGQKDFAGTIDAIISIDGTMYLVDFKGMNVQDFMKFARYGVIDKHRLQIVGYAMIANGGNTSWVIKKCLLVGESKGGPISGGNAIGLHEDCIDVDAYKGEVRKRLTLLRSYEKNNTTPPIECENTRQSQFGNCPYSKFCKDEVQAVERKRNAARGDAKVARTQTPKRK